MYICFIIQSDPVLLKIPNMELSEIYWKYYAENISTLMRVVGTLNNTRPSRQLSPKDSQVVYSFGFSYENFLFKSETFLLIEIFINLQTPMIFFACER